jgi:ankyrin repeat protein
MCMPIRGIRVRLLTAALVRLSVVAALPAAVAAQAESTIQIFEAAHSGDPQRVAELLRLNPDLLEAKDGDGMTPLFHAVVGGHVELARLLLNQGADISAKDAGPLG